jgi:hypothetical protein
LATVAGGIFFALKAIASWGGWSVIGNGIKTAFGWLQGIISAVATAIQVVAGAIGTVVSWFNSSGGGHATPKEGPNGVPSRIGVRALGGSVMAGNSYLMGENGPEIYTVGASGYITPNNQLNSHGGAVTSSATNYYSITVVSPDGKAVVNALKQYQRENGSVPITTRAALRLGPA